MRRACVLVRPQPRTALCPSSGGDASSQCAAPSSGPAPRRRRGWASGVAPRRKCQTLDRSTGRRRPCAGRSRPIGPLPGSALIQQAVPRAAGPATSPPPRQRAARFAARRPGHWHGRERRPERRPWRQRPPASFQRWHRPRPARRGRQGWSRRAPGPARVAGRGLRTMHASAPTTHDIVRGCSSKRPAGALHTAQAANRAGGQARS